MRASLSSGSTATGLSLIGPTLMALFPEYKWIGWTVIATGLLIILFDIKIEHGQFAAGTPKTLGARLKAMWPQLLIAISLVLLGIGVWGYINVGRTEDVKSAKIDAGTQQKAPEAIAAQNPAAARAQLVSVAKVQSPPRSIAGEPGVGYASSAASPDDKRQFSGAVGKFVIQGPRFDEDPKKPGEKRAWLTIKNTGPGTAYAGNGTYDFEILAAGQSIPNFEKRLDKSLALARKFRPLRSVSIESGDIVTFPYPTGIKSEDWQAVVAGTKQMIAWQTYAYYTDATPKGKIEIAVLVAIYTDGTGSQISMGTLKQLTQTYPEDPQ